MPTKLIELTDGILIEVETPPGEVQPLAFNLADKVSGTVDRIRPLLVNTCRPIIAAWQELSQDMHIEQAEMELGLSFEGEGNVYVTKAKSGANLTVKLILKPKR